MQQHLDEFLASKGGTDGIHETGTPELVVVQTRMARLPDHMLYHPSLCMVVQGAKQVELGEQTLVFGEDQALAVGLDLPVRSTVLRGEGDTPYRSLVLSLDVPTLQEIQKQLGTIATSASGEGPGLFVLNLDPELQDALLRLLRLPDQNARLVLGPSIVREIHYRLLTGPHGGAFARIAYPTGHTRRIALAIHSIQEDLTRPLRIEVLAQSVGMSPSAFHQHFKEQTAQSPLQYQKRLRLLEARRQMLTTGANSAEAAFGVGYQSTSQFSREYARLFGAPPRRDVTEQRSI